MQLLLILLLGALRVLHLLPNELILANLAHFAVLLDLSVASPQLHILLLPALPNLHFCLLLHCANLVDALQFLGLDFVGPLHDVVLALHSGLQLRLLVLLLLYLGALSVEQLLLVTLIVFLLQLTNILRLLSSVSNLFKCPFLLHLQHAHAVLQLLHVALNLHSDLSRLVEGQVLALNVDDHIGEPIVALGRFFANLGCRFHHVLGVIN